MSKLNRLFENAPEGATAIGQRGNNLAFTNGGSDVFLDGHWGISIGWKTIATRPQPERKTVEDAVAEVITGFEGKGLWYSPGKKQWTSSPGIMPSDSYSVCTQEEFEACVAAKAKSEPEWTHISTGGNKSRYLMETVHGDLYENEWGKKFIPGFDGCNSVEPIKTTITKAEHEFLCKFSADVNDIHVVNSVESYLAKHEVVE